MKIKAEHITNWNHPNAKFYPGDKVTLVDTYHNTMWHRAAGLSKIQYNHIKREDGTVIASSAKGGKQRGMRRQYTRYYVEFSDGYVGGYHSHVLTKAV
jgi:hypothetical protein